VFLSIQLVVLCSRFRHDITLTPSALVLIHQSYLDFLVRLVESVSRIHPETLSFLGHYAHPSDVQLSNDPGCPEGAV
jgi:hypothetical protein